MKMLKKNIDSDYIDVRNYGIDLLKILCMMMVVMIHVTGVILENSTSNVTYWIIYFLRMSCICAVDCFAIVSGYLGVDSKHRTSNIANLWSTVVFYTVSISLFVVFIYPKSFAVMEVIKAFLPVFSVQYWYFSSYFLLFFLMPLVNIFFKKSDRKQQISVLFAILLLSIGGVFFDAIDRLWAINEGYSVLWLLAMYYIGAYLKKNPIRVNIYWGIVYLICIAIIFALEVVSKYSNINILSFGMASMYSSPFTVMAAISLFMIFKRLDVVPSIRKMIALISSLSFSVYIIHYNKNIWTFLSNQILKYAEYNVGVILVLIVLTVLIIFSACILIDFVRTKIFTFLKIKKIFLKLEKLLTNIFEEGNSEDQKISFD